MLHMFLLKRLLLPHSTTTIKALLTQKNIENPTSESVTQPLKASPSESHMPIRLIEIGHNSPQQGNLTELSDNEKSFEY